MAKESHNRFLFYLCETLGKAPDHPDIADMPPWQRLWWYNSWIDKINQEQELTKYGAILTGSFHNPAAAKQMLSRMNPDVALTEEQEEEQARQLHEQIVREESEKNQKHQVKKGRRRRKRRMITDG